MSTDDEAAALAAIDRTESGLNTIVNDLWTDGVVTDDDAAEFFHRVETIAAELRACIEYTDSGPFTDHEC